MNEEEKIKKLEEKIKDLEGSKKFYEDKYREQGNCLQLFGYNGLSIPLDEEIKKEITNYIKKEIRRIMEENKDMEEMFIKTALNYRKAFINIFKPIVKQIIEDLDFNVSFKRDDYERD